MYRSNSSRCQDGYRQDGYRQTTIHQSLLRVGLALLVLLTLAPAQLTAQDQCWDLVWSDEFDGPEIDLSKWQFEVNGAGGGNNELQYYTDRPENAQIVDGVLNIIGRAETYTGPDGTRNYTSARLRTLNQGDWRYGRFEASIKLPVGQGMWPAFWMLPTDYVYGGWPQSGEIDIMENVGFEPDIIHGTIHYGDPWPNNRFSGNSTPVANSASEFHTYTVEWEEDEIRWYVDGVHYFTRVPSDIAPFPWPFDQRFHILLNLAIGGDWPGSPDASTVFPQHYEIDYVRVYQGINSYGIDGDNEVFEGETGKVYTMNDVPGATYAWTVPAGATITAGQGTPSITVDWGTTGGDVQATITTDCGTRSYDRTVEITVPPTVTHVFENFNDQRNVTYDLALTSGTLTENVANPGVDGTNDSDSVGRYVRNGGAQYDVLFMGSPDVGNANDYVLGRKSFTMDLYTDAPPGTKVSVQLEDAAKANSNGYPVGRHSVFDAFTSVQNGWQTLEFNWAASPDPQGTGIFDVDQLVVLFAPNSFTGHTYHYDNFQVIGEDEAPILSTEIIEDYDGTSNWSYVWSTGPYNPNFPNPGSDAVNDSATVAQYIRNAGVQYDILIYNNLTQIEDASLLTDGDNKILADIYTTAPVGTTLTFNLENSAIAAAPYPIGRHSVYQAKSTVQNQWETVTFEYSFTPDAGTPDVGIDQLIFLFDPGNFTGETYHIDNVRMVSTKGPTVYLDDTVYEDYDGNSLLSVGTYDGVYDAPVSNPDPGGVNTSNNAGQYTRNAGVQWDVLFFDTNAIAATDFEAETHVFAMDVYTSAPVGTPIIWQLEDGNLTTPGNFPTGRRSSYQGSVGAQNEWHTVRFKYNTVLDGGTSPNNITQVALLFDGGNYTGDTFLIDNLRSQEVTEGTFEPTATANGAFDEGTGTTADFGNSLVGDLVGGTSWGVGQQGGALEFDGTGYVELVDSGDSPFDLTDGLTLALWVRPDALGGTQVLLSKDNAYELEIGRDGGNAYGLRANNGGEGTGQTGLTEGVWQHVAVTWDGSTVRYYLNGEADGSDAFAGPLDTNDANVGVGARPSASAEGGPTFHFVGAIDAVQVYGQALDDAAIAALFSGTVTDIDPPLRTHGAAAPGTLSLTTDEDAECRHGTTSGVRFADLPNTFGFTGGGTHGSTVGVSSAITFHSVRCRDALGNVNNDDIDLCEGSACAGLAASWTFEEGTGDTTADVSGNGHGGTLSVDNQWSAGVTGGGLLFNTTHDVTVSPAPVVAGHTLTLAAWVKLDATGEWQAIVDARDGATDGYNLFATAAGNAFARVNGATVSGPNIVDGSWHHVVSVYDGYILSLYVDGVLEGSTPAMSAIDVAAPLKLGHHAYSTFNMSGRLDTVTVFSTALSASEVADLHSATAP